jgi:hypothetical protein
LLAFCPRVKPGKKGGEGFEPPSPHKPQLNNRKTTFFTISF